MSTRYAFWPVLYILTRPKTLFCYTFLRVIFIRFVFAFPALAIRFDASRRSASWCTDRIISAAEARNRGKHEWPRMGFRNRKALRRFGLRETVDLGSAGDRGWQPWI